MEQLSDMPAKQIFPGYSGKLVQGESSTLAFWEVITAKKSGRSARDPAGK